MTMTQKLIDALKRALEANADRGSDYDWTTEAEQAIAEATAATPMIHNEGTESEVTLRVVLSSDAYGSEYFDYDSLEAALEGIKNIVIKSVIEPDNFDSIVGIAIVPKDQYEAEGDELSESQIAAVYEFYTRQLRISYGDKAEAMSKRASVEEIVAGFEYNAELKAILSKEQQP